MTIKRSERGSRSRRFNVLKPVYERQPELLYKNPYINFLREYRLTRLDYDIPELYHEAALAWNRMTTKEKRAYNYTHIIKDIKRRREWKELKRGHHYLKRMHRTRRHLNYKRSRRALNERATNVRRQRRRRHVKKDASSSPQKSDDQASIYGRLKKYWNSKSNHRRMRRHKRVKARRHSKRRRQFRHKSRKISKKEAN